MRPNIKTLSLIASLCATASGSLSAQNMLASGSVVALSAVAAQLSADAATTVSSNNSASLPAWTKPVWAQVETLCSQPNCKADALMQLSDSRSALSQLLSMAREADGQERDAVLARYLSVAEQAQVNPTERYLLLRAANELVSSDDLRRKLIIECGQSQTVQALAFVRPYYDTQLFADAVALATVSIVKGNPEINGGRHVYNMLEAAKESFIRHYGEEGIDPMIDDVLKAIDEVQPEGYNLAPSHTSMGKRGFWNMSGQEANMEMAFDWKATGALTVSLHSVPVMTLDRHKGLKLAGSQEWHSYKTLGDWDTANIKLKGNRVTVSVNGQLLVSDVQLSVAEDGQRVGDRGYVAFTADDNGAVVEQVCLRSL